MLALHPQNNNTSFTGLMRTEIVLSFECYTMLRFGVLRAKMTQLLTHFKALECTSRKRIRNKFEINIIHIRVVFGQTGLSSLPYL